jgi:hypothetical protein
MEKQGWLIKVYGNNNKLSSNNSNKLLIITNEIAKLTKRILALDKVSIQVVVNKEFL